MSGPWTDEENAAICRLYLHMLDKALTGQKYVKSHLIRAAMSEGPLGSRSKGSIEAKLMNCSAAHADLDGEAVTMNEYGYRALPNYQKGLKVALANAIELDAELAANPSYVRADA